MAERPDVVLLLGDYVSTRPLRTSFVSPEVTAAVLGELDAPLGVYAVLGNHDLGFDGERVSALLAAEEIAVLRNRALPVEHGGREVWIAGVDDLTVGRDDLERALADVPDGTPTVLMTHSPNLFPRVPPHVALTVAGHTHGGQVDLP